MITLAAVAATTLVLGYVLGRFQRNSEQRGSLPKLEFDLPIPWYMAPVRWVDLELRWIRTGDEVFSTVRRVPDAIAVVRRSGVQDVEGDIPGGVAAD